MARPRVVIIGCGFGGLECAKKLDGGPVDVLLVDRNNYHVFTPLLYQVASSLLNPSDIAYPVRKIFRGSPNVRFRQAEVTALDLEAQTVTLHDGDVLGYDRVVVAAGATTNYFGNDAIARRSMGLKTLSEALQLRNHILACLEEASARPASEQRDWMTFVIVGGGPTGVEYAGALAELMRLVVEKEYPAIAVEPRIMLVEGGAQLLGMFPERLGRYAQTRLERLGVEVMLDTYVLDYDGETAELSDDEALACRTLVWSAGVEPEPVAEDAPGDPSGRIEVDAYCRLGGRQTAFAIGDIAAMRDEDGTLLPQLSPPAMQEGRYVADFISADVAGKSTEPPLSPFRYVDKGSMAVVGRGHAVAKAGDLELTGLLGWLAWLVVHIYYLIGFRNRLLVLWHWMWTYLFYDRPVRIIARAKAEPVARLPGEAAAESQTSRRAS